MSDETSSTQTIRMLCQIPTLNVRSAKDTSSQDTIVGQLHDGDVVTVAATVNTIGRIAWRTITEGEFADRFVAERFLNEIYLVELVENETSVLGADVSHHQGLINWTTMYDQGVRFAFIKATEGTTFVDSFFSRSATQAKTNNIITGAYHYYRSAESPLEQAMHFFRTAGGEVDLPLVVDLEATNNPDLPSESDLLQFLLRVEELSGSRPIIYSSPSYWAQMGNPEWSSDYPLWIAHHTSNDTPNVPAPWDDWMFWQYTAEADGATFGVTSTRLDLDLFQGTLQDLRDLAGVIVEVPVVDEHVRQPLLAPIVKKHRAGQDFFAFNRDGVDEPQLGVNGRKFAFLDIDPELVRNGSNWWVLQQQLDAVEQMNATILRVYAKRKDVPTPKCIDQMSKLLNELKHRARPIRALIVLNDSLTGANMYFSDELAYHTGPMGHLSTDYWRDKAYRGAFTDFLKDYIPGVMADFEGQILGFQIINEPQLTQDPLPTAADTEVFIAGMNELCEMVFNLAGGKLPVGTGLRDTLDVSPSFADRRKWALKIHESPYISFISGNVYQEAHSANWEYLASHQINIDVALETRRPFLFTEIGTRHNQMSGKRREDVVHDFYDWAYNVNHVYACMPWALQVGSDRGFGSALHGLTFEVQGQPIFSTPAAFNESVKWGQTILPTLG